MNILHQNPNFDEEQFLKICDQIADRFVERTELIDRYVPEGIIHSDGLCICALCEMYEIDYLIEAGRANGGSTEMFARYFVNHPRLKHIWSVDLKINRVLLYLGRLIGPTDKWKHIHATDRVQERNVKQSLAAFKKIVSLIDGDAFVKIPQIISGLDLKTCRIGIFIDGPKEEPQMRLANQLLDLSPSVCFVALDDVGPRYAGRFERLLENQQAVFCTSDEGFYARYGWVNKGRLPKGLPERGSAFSGVGILVNPSFPRRPSRPSSIDE